MQKTNGSHRPAHEPSLLLAVAGGELEANITGYAVRTTSDSAALLLSLGDAIATHVVLLAGNGAIRSATHPWRADQRPSWLRLPDHAVGANYLAACERVKGKHAGDAKILAAAIRDAAAGRTQRVRLEHECNRRGGRQCFELCVMAIEHGPLDAGTSASEVVSVLVAHRDVTEVKLAKGMVEEYLGQVRRLATHLQDVREQERRVIAREIHDELGHQLTALKIDVVSLERELQRVGSTLAGRSASMKTLLDQVIGSVRRLSSELRPGLLDDFGLVAAIEWQVEAFEEHTGIAVEVVLQTGDSGIDPPTATAVFRILQESLTNVARHARADRVQVCLRRGSDQVHLEVRDNGSGFERHELRDPMSHGVAGMRERVLALGGAFTIDGLPGYGTTVSATLPLEHPAGAVAQPPLSRLAVAS
jgi:signal transduction histidine kinase